MANWKNIIDKNHIGYNDIPDYKEILKQNPINKDDLDYFEGVIDDAMSGGNADYDMFPDNGGIDIAKVLLEEVKRQRLQLSIVYPP